MIFSGNTHNLDSYNFIRKSIFFKIKINNYYTFNILSRPCVVFNKSRLQEAQLPQRKALLRLAIVVEGHQIRSMLAAVGSSVGYDFKSFDFKS